MNTSITRPDPGRRLRLLSTEESHKAGNFDAEKLLAALRNMDADGDASCLLADTMNDIMALAFDNRPTESIERLDGFCAIIGPVLGPVHSSRFVFTSWNLGAAHGSANVE